jgi:hypothetical protein
LVGIEIRIERIKPISDTSPLLRQTNFLTIFLQLLYRTIS